MSRTPRVPGFKKAQPNSKPSKRHQQPDDYKSQFLSDINACLKDTEYLTPNRRPTPEPAKRPSQIPKRASGTKKSMIPTPKRSQRQEIVPLQDTDVNHVFELEISSESPSPRKVPRRTPEPQRKSGTPSRIQRAFSPARRPSSMRKAEGPRTKDDSDLIRMRREGNFQVERRRKAVREEEEERPEMEDVGVEVQKKGRLVVSDLIVFSDSPEKEEGVGNLIDLSPVAAKEEPDLISLSPQPQTYTQPPSENLLDLMMLAERPAVEKEVVETPGPGVKDDLLDFMSPLRQDEEKKDEEKQDEEKRDDLLNFTPENHEEEKKEDLLNFTPEHHEEEKKEERPQEGEEFVPVVLSFDEQGEQPNEEEKKEELQSEPNSIQGFIHSVLGLPAEIGGEKQEENEDAIFAFQERLCSIIEVEIVHNDGKRVTVFPTKLNEYLHNKQPSVETPKSSEPPVSGEKEEIKRDRAVSDSEDWVAVGHVDSPTSDRNSPQMSLSRSVEDIQGSPLSVRSGRSPTEVPLSSPRRRMPKRPNFSSSPSDFSASAGSDFESPAVAQSDQSFVTPTPSPLHHQNETKSPFESESPSPYVPKHDSVPQPDSPAEPLPESPSTPQAESSTPPSPEPIEEPIEVDQRTTNEPIVQARKVTPVRSREQRKSWMPSPRKSPLAFSKGDSPEVETSVNLKRIPEPSASPRTKKPSMEEPQRTPNKTPQKVPQRIPRKSPQKSPKKLLESKEESPNWEQELREKLRKEIGHTVSPRIPKKSPQRKPTTPQNEASPEGAPKLSNKAPAKSPARTPKKTPVEEMSTETSESETPEQRSAVSHKPSPMAAKKSPIRAPHTPQQEEARVSSAESSEIETPDKLHREVIQKSPQRIASKSPLRKSPAKKSQEATKPDQGTREKLKRDMPKKASPLMAKKAAQKTTKKAVTEEDYGPSEHEGHQTTPHKTQFNEMQEEPRVQHEVQAKPGPKAQKKSPPSVSKKPELSANKKPVVKETPKKEAAAKQDQGSTPQMKVSPKPMNQQTPKQAEKPAPSTPESPSKPLPFNFNLKEMQKMFQSPPREVPKPPPPSPQRKTLASALIRADSSDYSD